MDGDHSAVSAAKSSKVKLPPAIEGEVAVAVAVAAPLLVRGAEEVPGRECDAVEGECGVSIAILPAWF